MLPSLSGASVTSQTSLSFCSSLTTLTLTSPLEASVCASSSRVVGFADSSEAGASAVSSAPSTAYGVMDSAASSSASSSSIALSPALFSSSRLPSSSNSMPLRLTVSSVVFSSTKVVSSAATALGTTVMEEKVATATALAMRREVRRAPMV